MKQSVENGWSSNVLKIQIETNLFKRQIETQKVNNFTKTLPAPQSDLANYLLKDPYIFDVAGTKELADALNGMVIDGITVLFKEATEHRAVMVLRGENLSSAISDTDPKKRRT